MVTWQCYNRSILLLISNLGCKPPFLFTFDFQSYRNHWDCLIVLVRWLEYRYMKIPPRALFICQVYGTALGSITNYSLIKGVIASKRPFLDGTMIDPTQQWTGRRVEIFFSASVIFGLISPSRFFVGQYSILYLVRVSSLSLVRSGLYAHDTRSNWRLCFECEKGFIVGAILPFIPYYLYRRTSRPIYKQISIPLLLHGSIGPPQTPMNVLIPSVIVSFLSQFYALRYKPRWFERYNYVLSSALDAGTSINALVIYMLGINTFVRSFSFTCENLVVLL